MGSRGEDASGPKASTTTRVTIKGRRDECLAAKAKIDEYVRSLDVAEVHCERTALNKLYSLMKGRGEEEGRSNG